MYVYMYGPPAVKGRRWCTPSPETGPDLTSWRLLWSAAGAMVSIHSTTRFIRTVTCLPPTPTPMHAIQPAVTLTRRLTPPVPVRSLPLLQQLCDTAFLRAAHEYCMDASANFVIQALLRRLKADLEDVQSDDADTATALLHMVLPTPLSD